MMPKFEYTRPTSLKQAIRLLSSSGARAHAGGTDLLGCIRDRIFETSHVVSISALPELHGIKKTANGGVMIGALTTLAQLGTHPLITSGYPVLSEAALSAASPQLRNQGTLGGNLCQRPRCWYFRGDFHCLRKGGDTCFAVGGENEYHCIFGGNGCYIVHPSDTAPALMALKATVHIAGPAGSKSIPIDSFFVSPGQDVLRENILAPNEILTGVSLPPSASNLRSTYRKARARGAWDFALAGVACSIRFKTGGEIDEAQLVLSGVAPIPWRVPAAEKMLTGRRLDESTVVQVGKACVNGAEPMDRNAYKVDLVQALVEETLLALR